MKSLPKVSLRDLLWLIVVVALSVLWWMDHRELARVRKELHAALSGDVRYVVRHELSALRLPKACLFSFNFSSRIIAE